MALDGIYMKNNDSSLKVVPSNYDNSKMSQEDFMRVLLANLQWQDPLEAQDISQFIDNTVKLREMEVLNSFEDSVKEIKESLNSYSLVFASSFIGKEVEYKGNRTYVKGGKGTFEFSLSSPAQKVVVRVFDSKGNLVEEKELYSLSKGSYPFEIDNPSLADGYYTVSVDAYSLGGSKVDVEVNSFALVEGVKREDNKVYLKTSSFEIPLEEITYVGG